MSPLSPVSDSSKPLTDPVVPEKSSKRKKASENVLSVATSSFPKPSLRPLDAISPFSLSPTATPLSLDVFRPFSLSPAPAPTPTPDSGDLEKSSKRQKGSEGVATSLRPSLEAFKALSLSPTLDTEESEKEESDSEASSSETEEDCLTLQELAENFEARIDKGDRLMQAICRAFKEKINTKESNGPSDDIQWFIESIIENRSIRLNKAELTKKQYRLIVRLLLKHTNELRSLITGIYFALPLDKSNDIKIQILLGLYKAYDDNYFISELESTLDNNIHAFYLFQLFITTLVNKNVKTFYEYMSSSDFLKNELTTFFTLVALSNLNLNSKIKIILKNFYELDKNFRQSAQESLEERLKKLSPSDLDTRDEIIKADKNNYKNFVTPLCIWSLCQPNPEFIIHTLDLPPTIEELTTYITSKDKNVDFNSLFYLILNIPFTDRTRSLVRTLLISAFVQSKTLKPDQYKNMPFLASPVCFSPALDPSGFREGVLLEEEPDHNAISILLRYLDENRFSPHFDSKKACYLFAELMSYLANTTQHAEEFLSKFETSSEPSSAIGEFQALIKSNTIAGAISETMKCLSCVFDPKPLLGLLENLPTDFPHRSTAESFVKGVLKEFSELKKRTDHKESSDDEYEDNTTVDILSF